MLRNILATVCLAVGGTSVISQEPVDYQRDIAPLFQQHCLACHSADDQQSGLRLDLRSSMLRGGDHGLPSLVPGQPDNSFLLAVVSAAGTVAETATGQPASGSAQRDAPRMPPEGPPLSSDQIDRLRRWIAAGAPWPGQMEATAADVESQLWSLQPVRTKQTVDIHSLSSTIDRLVEEKLAAAGLTPSPPADAITQLRRVSLVLTGLPPTPEELEEFLTQAGLNMSSATSAPLPADQQRVKVAYESAVERLLSSPRYGERWAQHWLDIIRWGETVGFETNAERTNAWPYRDWVIAALNDDLPYDQFLFAQIAGDTVGQDAALGFLVAGPANLPGQIGRDEEAMRQARQDELDEVISTVSQAALGLTVGCARCHNHKFDPILQRDYYAMQAMFAGMRYGQRRWRGEQNDRWTEQLPTALQHMDAQLAHCETLRKKHHLQPPLETLVTVDFEPRLARGVRMEIAATGSGGPASLYEFEVWSAANNTNPTPTGETFQDATEGDIGAATASGKAKRHNVALASAGASAAASSFALANQSRHFDNLIDGSNDQRQAFPWEASSPGPAWIEVLFAQPAWIDRIVWDRGSTQPADFTIQVLYADDPLNASRAIVARSDERWLREDDTRAAEHVRLRGLTAPEVASVVDANARLRSARAELARLSAGPQVFAAVSIEQPEATWLLSRGDPMQRRDAVEPAIPRVLGDLGLTSDSSDVQRRTALAQHLTDPAHPLTARVIVNRVWQHHFGTGLVDTPSDFGAMGSSPTHPELLDQLSASLITSRWSLKQLHRQIVLSETFRQSNQPRDDALAIDADTRWLWRYPPRRMEAEAIRDSILLCGGNLNLHMGGPGFNLFRQRGGLADYDPLETFDEHGARRMIYAHKVRMQSVDVFGPFDCPDAGQMQPKRTRSITPTQSLGLFNSPFVWEQAQRLATRVKQVAASDADENTEAADKGTSRVATEDAVSRQIQTLFGIAYSRPASQTEIAGLHPLVATEEGLEQLCRVVLNSSEFLTIP